MREHSGGAKIVFLCPGPPDPDGNSLSTSGPSGPGRKQIQSGGILNTGAIEALAFNTVPDKVSERPMAVPGPFFFEAPTETVGRRPCSHGGGPLRELDGQCPPSPIAGSPVPCSAPSGALRRNIKVCGHPSAPCAAASALRHWPPRRGAAGYGPPLLRGFACRLRRHQRTAPVPVSARLARAIAACARPSLRRRLGPPLASLRPAGGSDGSGTRSCGSPLGCSGWACGPPYAPLRVRLRPFCAGTSAGPPKTAPARRGWSLGPLAPPRRQGYGLRSSRLGPGAALRAAFSGPRPQAFLEEAARGIKLDCEAGRVLELSAAVRRQG